MVAQVIGKTDFRKEKWISIGTGSRVPIQSTTQFQEGHVVDTDVLQEVQTVVRVFKNEIRERLL